MGDVSFGKLKGEALFVIDLRGDYATRRNVRTRMTVDDDGDRSKRPTFLSERKRRSGMRIKEDEGDDDGRNEIDLGLCCGG